MNEDDVRRRFDEIISTLHIEDTKPGATSQSGTSSEGQRSLRHPQRHEAATYRVRVDLEDANPQVWRQLDIRSDITLDVMHHVLQAAFAWTDSHLYRFAIGGGVWDRDSELFLCSFDVFEGDDEGLPATHARLDETLQERGDQLNYAYDYGDGWQVTVRLEEITEAANRSIASCVDGRRAAPPENSRGLQENELYELQGDPEYFDVAEVNQTLRSPYFSFQEAKVATALIGIVQRLRFTDVANEVSTASNLLAEETHAGSHDGKVAALGAYLWFLERANDGGIPLTSAGYLTPSDVVEACQQVPMLGARVGKNNREINNLPLLRFRQSLVTQGLLRKYKGRLLLTRASAAAQADPDRIWQHLVDRWRDVIDGMRAARGRRGSIDEIYSREATMMILLAVASDTRLKNEITKQPDWISRADTYALDQAARWLTALGWRLGDGDIVRGTDLYGEPILDVLESFWDRQQSLRRPPTAGAVAKGFAQEVLTRDSSRT